MINILDGMSYETVVKLIKEAENDETVQWTHKFGKQATHIDVFITCNSKRFKELFFEMVPKSRYNAVSSMGSTLLHHAACSLGTVDIDVIKHLIDNCENINQKMTVHERDGWTPLCQLIYRNDRITQEMLEIAEYMICKGADPNIEHTWSNARGDLFNYVFNMRRSDMRSKLLDIIEGCSFTTTIDGTFYRVTKLVTKKDHIYVQAITSDKYSEYFIECLHVDENVKCVLFGDTIKTIDFSKQLVM